MNLKDIHQNERNLAILINLYQNNIIKLLIN